MYPVVDSHAFTMTGLKQRLDATLGKTLAEVDSAGVFKSYQNNKKVTGIAGHVIEQSVLEYPPDNAQKPDLLVDGTPTELKTTGLRLSKKQEGYEAKEPMSITAVSINKIAQEDFNTSNFWHKLEHMLIVYYLYDAPSAVSAQDYANFVIKGYQFHEFTPQEIEILKNDWLLVQSFITRIQDENPNEEDRKKLYPKLSSALRKELMFIDTAPKYPHPPRFRLKRSVVTTMARKNFGAKLEQLPHAYTSYNDIDQMIAQKSSGFIGKTINQICDDLGLAHSQSKNISEQIICNIFDGKAGKISNIEFFSEIGLTAKSITLTKQHTRTEDMKLFTIDFDEFLNPDSTFEDSQFYDYFYNRQILFTIFEEPSEHASLGENVLVGFKRFTFSDVFIDSEVKRTWQEIKDLVSYKRLRFIPKINKRTGKQIINKTGVPAGAPNFPKSKDHTVFVRGTSSDSTHMPECINGISMYKQQAWIKGTFIASLLEEEFFNPRASQ